jgi:hypothetical protein
MKEGLMKSHWLDGTARRIANRTRPLNEPASGGALLSRRASLKHGLGAAAAVTAAVTTAASTGVATAELTGQDDNIITAIDGWLENNDLFGEIGAALVFYEAADVLGANEPPSAVQCEPDQIFCSCYGGFCLVAGDCSSYCS